MFDSVQGGILPLCIIAAIAGILLGRLKQLWIGVILAPLIAIAASCFWYWLPELIWPAEHTESQGGWILVAMAYWSAFAVPVSVVALLVSRRLSKSGQSSRA